MTPGKSPLGEKSSAPGLNPTNLVSGLAAGIGTAFAFGMGGFILVYDETGSMGSVL